MQIQAVAAYNQGAALEPYTFELKQPKANECLIKVLACGLCHSDIHMLNNDWGWSHYPLVPGHEVVGEVVEIGSQVKHLRIGDRVGVGWQRSACLQCQDCLKGHENLCDQGEALIVNGYGGFADHLLVDARFAFRIPSGIETHAACPLLCAGITVYSALRHAGMRSGQEIGIIGIGGLGHLAIQFASRLGNRVTVFTTSDDKAEFATKLGAHDVIITSPEDTLPVPVRKLDILLSTTSQSLNWAAYLNYLNSDGFLSIVGVCPAPLSIPLLPLIIKRRRVMASIVGSRSEMIEMLSIAERFEIKPIVEIFPMRQIGEAIEKIRQNKIRFRAVLSLI
ncbi:MAG: NAD(P)-dependent alcohol dehydrogenase [Nostoc sp. DedQUE12a]|nr:NAD(P)-dependent alcohol dehydrogenase [Nostoc sp. DedQUE12a]